MEVDDETCNVDASPACIVDLTPTTWSRAGKNVETEVIAKSC